MNSADFFERERPQLTNIAYSMLGRFSEAQDIVQEAFLRWDAVDHSTIHSPKAYLTTVVSRLCLDQLKSAHSQRMQYKGPWLPEPVVTSGCQIPDSHIELVDCLTIAFLHLLEQLNPVQRAVFLLHDVFGYTFKEIAEVIGKKTATCRKIAQRSRDYLRKQRPELQTKEPRQSGKAEEFIRALQSGKIEEIENLLAEEAILYSDGGEEVAAAPKPIHGAHKIGRFLRSISRKRPQGRKLRPAQVNHRPGIIILQDGTVSGVFVFDMLHGVVEKIYIIRNPYKVQHINRSS